MKTLPSFTAQQSLFRAYDIRGEHYLFTSDFIATLAIVFATLYRSQSYYNFDNKHNDLLGSERLNDDNKINIYHKTQTIVIGFDVRHGSDSISHTLASILQSQGLIVINLGLVTTPMMAFWAYRYDGHGIMITASHSAKDKLGIKWLVANESPSSLEIQALYQQLSFVTLLNPLPVHSLQISDAKAGNIINLPAQLISSTYSDAIEQVFTHINPYPALPKHKAISKPKLNITVVIDCMHGATSYVAQPLFERFCQRVIMLNDTPDGSFPAGNPDPTEPNRLIELQQAVIMYEADIGLAFDGDGDRLMVIDNSGDVIVADHLLYLLAQVAVTEQSCQIINKPLPSSVLFDIKCSHHLYPLLAKLGVTPVMTRTGSSLLRQQLHNTEQQALFAGELSGHFIFNDGYFIAYDDAMYAALRLMHWLAYTAPTLNTLAELTSSSNSSMVVPSYTLTDITKNLPTSLSSADHYLPRPKSKIDDCTLIEHLSEYCQYIQRLAHANVSDKEVHSDAIFVQSISCRCFSAAPPMLKTQAEAQHLLPIGTQLSFIDGIRLDFANGFGVLRESNTSHSLTARLAGDSLADIEQIQSSLVALCRLFDKPLAEKIAAIRFQ